VLMPMKSMAALLIYVMILPFSTLQGAHAVVKYASKGAYHMSWLLAMIGIDLGKKRNF